MELGGRTSCVAFELAAKREHCSKSSRPFVYIRNFACGGNFVWRGTCVTGFEGRFTDRNESGRPWYHSRCPYSKRPCNRTNGFELGAAGRGGVTSPYDSQFMAGES